MAWLGMTLSRLDAGDGGMLRWYAEVRRRQSALLSIASFPPRRDNEGSPRRTAMINLILAVVWLLIGGGMLFVYYTTNDPRLQERLSIGNGMPIGWLVLLMAVWNVIRWYSVRAARQQRQQLDLSRAEHRYPVRRSEPIGEPNPDFNFTDEPPPVRLPKERPPESG
jgi:hypothetical protein